MIRRKLARFFHACGAAEARDKRGATLPLMARLCRTTLVARLCRTTLVARLCRTTLVARLCRTTRQEALEPCPLHP